MLTILNQVLIIFILIIVGYITAKRGYVTREVKRGLVEILVNLSIPAMVIVSLDTELPIETLQNGIVVLTFSMLAHLISAILGYVLYRSRPEQTRVVFSFSMVFTNCAFMGYPLLESIFGNTGVFYTSLYVLAFNIFLWTYGVILFTGKKDIKVLLKSLVNPGTISVLIGLVLLLTPLKMPFVLTKVLGYLGALTTPLAMIVIGSMLAEVRLREMFQGKTIYFFSALRLILIPAAAFLILRAFQVDSEIVAICTTLVGLPAASNVVLFVEKFKGDSMLATRVVVMTTALSIITIPLLVHFAGG